MIIKIFDVVCKSCLHVAELDIFRDEWICHECSTSYDNHYLESKLIELVKDSLTFYQIQDIYCKKCKLVKEDLLTNHCKCSGTYSFQIEDHILPLIGTDTKKAKNALYDLSLTNKFYILSHTIKSLWINWLLPLQSYFFINIISFLFYLYITELSHLYSLIIQRFREFINFLANIYKCIVILHLIILLENLLRSFINFFQVSINAL